MKYMQMALIAIGGFVGSFLGGVDGFIYALLTMIAIDYILGVMIAIIHRKLSSAVGFKGIAKKIMILAFVGVGSVIDTYIIGNGGIVRTAVIFFYFANEGISIIENAAVIGLPVPKVVQEILIQVKEEGENGNQGGGDIK